MNKRLLFVGLLAVCWQSNAAVLPPEKLLPKDAVAVITVLDGAKSWASFTNSCYGRMWEDPAMKPFKDKFFAKLQSDLVGPAEKEMGIKLADYQGLIQGQFTLALLQNEPKAESPFMPLLLLDTRDQAPKLKTLLADSRKKWVDAGKKIKTEQIRGVEFNTFIATGGELSNVLTNMFPDKSADSKNDSDEKDASEKVEITVGMSDSLLIISASTKAIEKVLTRQSGGLIPALEEDPAFQADYAARLRGVPAYAWVNAKSILNTVLKLDADAAKNASALSPQKILAGIGLTDLTTVAMAWRDTPEGFLSQIFVGVPEASRKGIFKMMAAERKDANPPPFVPADAVKFVRWRLDMAQFWNSLENMVGDIYPGARGAISMVFDSAGKDKDEKYDLKSELIGSLGNDIINYQKNARGKTMADLSSPPSLFLVGSPKAEKLAAAIKVATESFVPTATIKESDFLGRKLYTVTPAQTTGAEAGVLNFAASGAYVAFSSQIAVLEEYLRSSDSKTKPLSDTPGLNEAAQKVGGMNTGLFGFDNQNEQMRQAFDVLRRSSNNLAELFGPASLAGRGGPADALKEVSEWADFSLLPPFEVVSKYFYYTVYAGSFGADGFTMSIFAPNPPKAQAKAQ